MHGEKHLIVEAEKNLGGEEVGLVTSFIFREAKKNDLGIKRWGMNKFLFLQYSLQIEGLCRT